jgi:hypothetical protein
LFALALFTSAFLLFLVQPVFARLVLPLLGGVPAVWTTCMLFFQSALLAGYAYAHVLSRRLQPSHQALVHVAVVIASLAALPVGVPAADHTAELRPVAWLLETLVVSIGAPFVALAATTPLLQRWFAASEHPWSRDPYFLYATSNAGSLLALLAYPVAIEPLLSLSAQRRLWSLGYVVAVGLVGTVAWVLHRAGRFGLHPSIVADPTRQPTARERLEWMSLTFVPSSLLLAVTTYLSTDVAAVPLLWIVPLAIYLSAFIVGFSEYRGVVMAAAARGLPLVLLPLILLMVGRGGGVRWFVVCLNLALLAAMSLLCLGRLAVTRPQSGYLTEFYLWLAAGGMFAGVFNAILAPRLFNDVDEYPVVIAAGCLLLAAGSGVGATLRDLKAMRRPMLVGLLAFASLRLARSLQIDPRGVQLLLAAPALICLSVARQPPRFAYAVTLLLTAGWLAGTDAWGRVVHTERSFFGVYRVGEAGEFRTLYHGAIVHGRQSLRPGPPEPLTYYHRGSPIADVLQAVTRTPRSIGVIGLGVGSLAAYGRPGDRWTFYEIDPAIERIARDTRLFRFLASCESCSVVIGDARSSLASTGAVHDLLVLDAFSSDAIPVHLLTREALAVYAKRLVHDGLMAIHISNRNADLRPVIARAARDLQWTAIARFDHVPEDDDGGLNSSDWVLMARDISGVAVLNDRGWIPLVADDGRAWADDFSNLWTSLRWR